jgi:hypothetical protein
MDRLPTTDIPGWVHPSLQGEVIDHGNVPAHELLVDTRTPVVIRPEHVSRHISSEVELFRVSPNHGRSYELGPNADRTTDQLGRVAIWRDEFENGYTSYSLKGNNFTHSTVMESSTAPSGYIPMGLLESDALLRVVRSSRLLREAGISTEWINRVFEPQLLLYKGEAVSQEEYKQRLLSDTANTRGLEEMVKIAAAIEPMTFFITGRSMEINDRLADFASDTPESARKRLQRIFAVYNATHEKDEGFKRLQPAREADRIRFFKKIYPTLLGTSLAKLHNANLVHTFPTLSNVTILGGIIDLDSVRGEPLGMGDAPLSASDRANDIATVIDYDDPSLDIASLYGVLHRLGLIPRRWDVVNAHSNLINAYEGARIPLSRKQDRLVETMVISGANWKLSGYEAFRTYDKLARSEAVKVLNIIWEKLSDMIEAGWSDESIRVSAKKEIDLILQSISRALSPGEEIDLTKEMLAPALDELLIGMKRLDDEVDISFAGTLEEIETNNDLIKLRTYIPDKPARLRVLRGVIGSALRHVLKEKLKKVGEDALRQKFTDIFDDEVNSFLERLKPTDWQVLAHTYDTFEVVKGVPAGEMIVYQQKSTYSFENVGFTALIKSALDSNIPVVTQRGEKQFNSNDYMFPSSGLVARNAFSDGSRYRLMRLIVADTQRTTVGAAYTDTNQDISYFAWLCESEADDSRVLYVYTDNHKQIDTLIAQHPTTTSTHSFVEE